LLKGRHWRFVLQARDSGGLVFLLASSPDGCALDVGYLLEPERYIRLWQVLSFEQIAAAEGKTETEQP
jgi:hypothetical protein